MTRKEPNWYAAACGIAYIVSFLFLTAYKAPYGSYSGMSLLDDSPVLLILLACGVAMSVSAVFLEGIISLGVGAGSALITLIFGFLGLHVIPEGTLIQVIGGGLESLVGKSVSVDMGLGMVLCLLLCITHVVLELILGQRKTRRIQPELWEENRNDSISF